MYCRNTSSSVKDFVDFGFVKKLRKLGLDWLKFNSNVVTGFNILALIYLAKCTTTTFFDQFIFTSNSEIHYLLN